MGDRYTITLLESQLKERFSIEISRNFKPSYNAGPTQLLPIITQGSKGLSYFYWGQIPGWSKNKSISKKLLYVNAEEIKSKSSLSSALSTHRCIIPMDGYYEWKPITKKGRVAHRIIFNKGETVGVAGLWEEFESENEIHHTFKIITLPSNGVLQGINHRMPAVVAKEQEDEWLHATATDIDIDEVLIGFSSDQIHMYSVSPKIENLENNSPKLIEPFAPADQFGNYSLFD